MFEQRMLFQVTLPWTTPLLTGFILIRGMK